MRTFLGASLLAIAACSDSGGDGGAGPAPGPSGPPSAAASVQATAAAAFVPANVGILAGGTVTWGFGSLGHNVTFDDVVGAPADIPGVNTNTSIARTFPVAGTYPYHCTLHQGMAGTVAVIE